MPSQSVLVIGGGLAGLSSAVALAESGLRVCLLEKRPYLGGRATSYTLPDGSEVDNCQHVTLGCCTNLSDFYRRVGAAEKIRFYDRLYFADRTGRRSTMAATFLPPPLHMAPSFLFFDALRLADKKAIADAMLTITRCGGHPPDIDGLSMLDWLRRQKQTESAIHRFWRVVLVSALDEELDRTDARYGIDVFWKAFLCNRTGYRLGVPAVPLGDLYEGCCTAISRRGGEVRFRSTIREISLAQGRFSGIKLEDGSELTADSVVLAVPHDAAIKLLPAELSATGGPLDQVSKIKTSPITGVHLWFDRAVMTEPFLALLDHTIQWIFNKTKLYSETTAGGLRQKDERDSSAANKGQYLQLVISASYDLVPMARQEIIALSLRELADVLPETRSANLLKATVVKEVNATFSPEPGSDRWRPHQDIGMQNLFLAGDWTQTGWPSTMEGAVRSGYLAAEAVLHSFDQSKKFLQPDLPFEGFCRMWAHSNGSVAS